jgi:hypothetical protein
VEADRSQKVDVISNDTQTVNVEPSERLNMDELHQDKVTQTNVAKELKQTAWCKSSCQSKVTYMGKV